LQVSDAASTSTATGNTVNNTIHQNNTTINGNVDNRQTNVTINLFGAENIGHILDDKRRMDRYIENCHMSIPYMIRDVHFDPERPDNHTVRMPNCRDMFVEVMTNQGWRTKMKKEVVNDMIQRHGDSLEEHFKSDECATRAFLMRKHFGQMIKACVEMPYDKEKRTALENEIMMVIKDGRRSCTASATSTAGTAGTTENVVADTTDVTDAAATAQDLRDQLDSHMKMIEELRKDKDELARQLELMYSADGFRADA
jgi:hypothetical protein